MTGYDGGHARHGLGARTLPRVQLVHRTPEDLGLAPRPAPVAPIVTAYHELMKSPQMFARPRTVLRPGGRLVIATPISPAARP
jgi:hypothetical protein